MPKQISISTFDLRFALLVPLQSENASYAPALNNQPTNDTPIWLVTLELDPNILGFYYSTSAKDDVADFMKIFVECNPITQNVYNCTLKCQIDQLQGI